MDTMYAKICVVLAVIAILAIAIWGLNGRIICKGVPARVVLSERQISWMGPIAKALASYKWDMGKFPDTADGLRSLFRPKEFKDKDLRYTGPYLEGTFEELTDPWGQPFEYRSPGKMNEGEYDLWSHGPDKKNDEGKKGSDDIKNWKDK